MKVLYKKITNMRPSQRVEFIIAAVLSLFLLVAVPIYAWFTYVNRLENLTKIKAPTSLDIRAGHKDAIEYLELKDIDIEDIKDNGNPKRYVFCVKTGNESLHYDIQLAHTTNIPFLYTLYRAEEGTEGETGVCLEYVSPVDDETYYYKKSGSGEALPMTLLNGDTDNTSHYGRTIAKNNDGYYSKTYDVAVNDGTPEIYAIPLYSQCTDISSSGTDQDPDYDFFILELNWDNNSENNLNDFNKWNKADNNKETDIIYISASIHGQ